MDADGCSTSQGSEDVGDTLEESRPQSLATNGSLSSVSTADNDGTDIKSIPPDTTQRSDVVCNGRSEPVATETSSPRSTVPIRSTASSPTSRSTSSELVCETETESTFISNSETDDQIRRRRDSQRGSQYHSRSRRMSFRLMSQHGPVLQEEMTMDGHQVSVSLADDGIEWRFKKSGKKRLLKFDEIFAVMPVLQRSKNSPQQSSSPSAFLKTLKRQSDVPPDSTALPKPQGFCVYSLHPDKPGHVVSSEFKCSSAEMGVTWLESIKTLMHEMCPRPRKLYVVINPLSGKGQALKTWEKLEQLFLLADVDLTVTVTGRKGHGRELTQLLDCNEYDGIVGVGGDGLYSELLNGLLIQAQFSAGVILRRARFIPVQPTICLGMIPTGFTNTIAHSLLRQPHPVTAAVQIILGRSVQMDVCSVYSNGQLTAFSSCGMNYSIGNVELLPKPEEAGGLSWLDEKISSLGRKIAKKSFDVSLMYVPGDEEAGPSPCSSFCQHCLFHSRDSSAREGPTLATASATFKEVDKADMYEWKTRSMTVQSISIAPHMCASSKHPLGISPDGHFGDGCVDIIVKRASRLSHTLSGNTTLSNVEVIKAREFKFNGFKRRPSRHGDHRSSPYSTDQEDEDEKTNRIAGKRTTTKYKVSSENSLTPSRTSTASSSGTDLPQSMVVVGTGDFSCENDSRVEMPPAALCELPPGCWVLDGDVTNLSDIDVRSVLYLRAQPELCARDCPGAQWSLECLRLLHAYVRYHRDWLLSTSTHYLFCTYFLPCLTYFLSSAYLIHVFVSINVLKKTGQWQQFRRRAASRRNVRRLWLCQTPFTALRRR